MFVQRWIWISFFKWSKYTYVSPWKWKIECLQVLSFSNSQMANHLKQEPLGNRSFQINSNHKAHCDRLRWWVSESDSMHFPLTVWFSPFSWLTFWLTLCPEFVAGFSERTLRSKSYFNSQSPSSSGIEECCL